MFMLVVAANFSVPQDGSGVMSLESTSVLVLDEADRMCDMGFEADIKNVVAQMNPVSGEMVPA